MSGIKQSVKGKVSGFTLLEVLVALAVLAITLSSLIQTVSLNARTVGMLRDRTFAHWVAMNQITEMQVAQEWPGTGTRNGKVEMAGKEWGWTIRVTDTPNPTIRRLDVEVFQSAEREEQVTSLIGYLQQPDTQVKQGESVAP
jgi:general secretion pathway protein I